MKTYIQIFSIIFCLTIICSCSDFFVKTLELDDVGFERELVFNAFLDDSSDTIFVMVSENTSILEPEQQFELILDATVELLYEGEKISDFTLGSDGRYYANLDQENRPPGTYELIVTHNELGVSRAITEIPEEITISKMEFIPDAGFDPLEQTNTSAVRIEIQDPPEDNYYGFFVKVDDDLMLYDTAIFEMDTFVELIIPSVSNSLTDINANFIFNGEILLPDDAFNGRSYIINLKFRVRGGLDLDVDKLEDHLNLYWKVVSEDYYKFQTSLNDYMNSGFGIFAEPIGVHTNVENGLGIFAGSNVNIIPLVE